MTDLAAYAKLSEEMKKCTACPLCTTRNEVVVDRGNPDARLLFIGEAPGSTEDLEGKAFVGPSGELLDQFLAEAGITAGQFHIINVLKCRPPENAFPGDERSLYGEEIVPSCLPWLDKQIDLIQPKVIVLVGRKAVDWTIYRDRRPAPNMKDIAFKWIRADRYHRVEIFVMYHTAYLLRLRQREPNKAQQIEDQTRVTLRYAADALNGTVPEDEPMIVRTQITRPRQGRFF